jgi:hypothetical protein
MDVESFNFKRTSRIRHINRDRITTRMGREDEKKELCLVSILLVGYLLFGYFFTFVVDGGSEKNFQVIKIQYRKMLLKVKLHNAILVVCGFYSVYINNNRQ